MLHRIKHWLHWLHWHPCELLEIVHEPNCPGFCTLDPPSRLFPRCNVKLRLRCAQCGKVELK